MADYCLWNLCNNNCIMCTNPLDFWDEDGTRHYTLEGVLQRMELERKEILESKEDISFTGGETTMHPHFVDFLKRVRESYPNNLISVATNGRRFFYEEFTKEVLKIKNLRLCVVVHSHKPETHDAVTRVPDSFRQTMTGLRNIFRYRDKTQMVELRVVLLKQNYEQINDISKMLYNEFPTAERVAVIFPEYEGHAQENFKVIKIKFSDVKKHIEEATENWGRKFKSYRLYHFPLCVVSHQYWTHFLRSLPPDHHETFFMKKCSKCYYNDCCLGVYKDYVKYFGEEEFSPIKKEIKGIKKDLDDYQSPIKNK